MTDGAASAGAGNALDIGRAIRHLRGDRPQAQLAAKARIDRTSWSLYEAGKRSPREHNLARIVRALGCKRVELEEAAWAFRRRRLAAEEIEPKPWRGARLSAFAAPGGPGPMLDREQWKALAGVLLDELIARLTRGGPPGPGGDSRLG